MRYRYTSLIHSNGEEYFEPKVVIILMNKIPQGLVVYQLDFVCIYDLVLFQSTPEPSFNLVVSIPLLEVRTIVAKVPIG